jgi:hypothetical protein
MRNMRYGSSSFQPGSLPPQVKRNPDGGLGGAGRF